MMTIRIVRWAAGLWAATDADKAEAYAEEWAAVLDCAPRWQRLVLALQFAVDSLCQVQRAQLSQVARRLRDRVRVPFIRPTGSTRVTGSTSNGYTTIEVIIEPARGQKTMNLGDTVTMMKKVLGDPNFQPESWIVTRAKRGGTRLRRTGAVPPGSPFDLFQPQERAVKPRRRDATPSTVEKVTPRTRASSRSGESPD